MNRGSRSRSVSAHCSALETSSPQYCPLQGDDSRSAVLSVSTALRDNVHCCVFLLDKASVQTHSSNPILVFLFCSLNIFELIIIIIWKLCGCQLVHVSEICMKNPEVPKFLQGE